MSLKQKLKNNELTLGSWIMMGNVMSIEVMALAGFDWLVVDIEHTSIDLETTQSLISTIQAKGIKALVRVSKNEEVVIKKILDMGADGIIVPMVNSKEDAIQAVNYVKYPPVGKRGVGLARAQGYGTKFEEYKERLQDEIVVIAQVEHIDSVNNLEEILSVEGIDGIIVGPYDLSGSMGKPGKFEDEDVVEAIKRVEITCKKMGKALGFHVISADHKEMLKKINDGFTFIAFSLDFFFLGESARNEMKKINY